MAHPAWAPTLRELTAGEKLKARRKQLGLSLRDVEAASLRLAADRDDDQFRISISRLSEIERRGAVPSIYRLYSLALIYRVNLPEVLSWFGVDM